MRTAGSTVPEAEDAEPRPDEPGMIRQIRRLVGAVYAEHRFRFSAGLAMSLVVAGLEAVGVAALVPLLELVGGGQDSPSRLGMLAADVAASVHISLTLETILFFMFGMVLAQQLATMVQAKLFAGLVYGYEAHLRDRLYSQVLGASWTFFLKQKVGNITDALTIEAQEAGAALSSLLALFSQVVVTLMYLGVALVFSWKMTLVTMAGALVVAWLLRYRVIAARRLGARIAAANAGLQSEAMEAVLGAKLIKASAAEPTATARFSRRTAHLAHSKYKNVMNEILLRALSDPLMFVLLLVGVYVSVRVFALPFEIVVAILFVFFRIAPRITIVQGKLLNVNRSLAALARIEDIESETRTMGETSGSVLKTGLTRSVRLDEVSFEYNAGSPVLRDVCIEIPRNRVTALVGPSGAGKSTIADIVMTLLRPTAGTMWLDDVDSREASIPSWRGAIGYVTQDAVFFHASIRENLVWTAPDATDENIAEALRVAHADGFVAQMPDGVDTLIGDRGVRMSGGQRQRLALARAVLRAPQLLILDEAMSALDAESEERIQEAIARIAQGTTVLVITHRLASVKGADHIYFVEDGRVVEYGSWAELTAASGRFREMMELQELGVRHGETKSAAAPGSRAG